MSLKLTPNKLHAALQHREQETLPEAIANATTVHVLRQVREFQRDWKNTQTRELLDGFAFRGKGEFQKKWGVPHQSSYYITFDVWLKKEGIDLNEKGESPQC